jgi:uncharacterized membrane protein YfcA
VETSFAAYQYLKKVTMNWSCCLSWWFWLYLLLFLGSTLLISMSNDFMKPNCTFYFISFGIYTYAKKISDSI